MFPTRKTLTATLAVTALSIASAPAALADSGHDHSPKVRTISTDVVAPFQLAVNDHHVYVADGGTSMVSRIRPKGLVTLAQGPQPGEVAGVDLDRSGKTLAYTSTSYANGQTNLTIQRKGAPTVVADLSGYEAKRNPDGHVSYGVHHPNKCVAAALDQRPEGPPASYKGIVDSHPYSVASVGQGKWVVADAAGNDLLKVDARGHVSTLAVLPRQPLKITKAIAAAQHMPDCVIGVTYNFEPVPTDVEVGPGGLLYVSTLPGGPEDPSLGARGSVYLVNPWTGKSLRVATGFLGATNLAVDRRGKVFVTELFAGRISTIEHGHARTFVDLPGALSVESDGDDLYAATVGPTDANGAPMGNGTVVRINR